MKKLIKLPAIILGLMLILSGFTQKAKAQDNGDNGDVSLETFYDELSPYGTWAQDPDYGYVWRPDVDMSSFKPYYTNGHWAMTEYGNTWVSDYEWGWAPFHYGRWVVNHYNEWIWIPDTVWGPAWVSWRTGGGFYGWAPLGPDYDGGDDYDTPNNWWVFVPQVNIYSGGYYRYYNRNANVYNRTIIINNRYGNRGRNSYFTGPGADDIRRRTHRDVTIYHVAPSNAPGRPNITNNTINIYRPRGGAGGGNHNAAPGQQGRNNGTPGQPGRNNNNNGDPRRQGQGQPNRTITGRTSGQFPGPGNSQTSPAAGGRNPGDRGQQQNPQQQNPQQQQQGQQQQQNQQQAQQQAQQRQQQQNQQQRNGQQMRIGQQRQQQMQQQMQQRQQQQNQQRNNPQQNQQQAQQQAQQRQQQQNQQNQQRQQQQQQAQQRQQQQNQQQQQQRQQQMQQQNQQRQQQQNQQRQQQQNQQRQQQQQQQRQQQQRPAEPAPQPRAN